jgi:hypothetical protein
MPMGGIGWIALQAKKPDPERPIPLSLDIYRSLGEKPGSLVRNLGAIGCWFFSSSFPTLSLSTQERKKSM